MPAVVDQADVELVTQNLLLREYRSEDFDDVHAYASDPKVVELLRWGPSSENETRAFLERMQQRRQEKPRSVYGLAVVLREEQKVIGGVQLVVPIPTQRAADMSYVLSQQYWRRGFMAEAVRELVRFGLEDIGLNRLTACCPVQNWGSALVLEKAGMKREARFTAHMLGHGEQWVDAFVYGIGRGSVEPPKKR
jgi:RimJ/RimL family protein N-acetyltransferase